jgi:hypothetical protein
MEAFVWIIAGGLLMSAIAMVGSLTILLKPATLERVLLPIVALAAGTLLGGAFFHIAASDLIPEIKAKGNLRSSGLHFGFFVAGLVLMFACAYGFHHFGL